ncbi:hypothetical protein RB620_13230 [Paenibacillus sp. LHD-117]|uniref:hypothetical protein n=1 Tax=Paenibacillus sp. LHD-117 TaxID=3071412 RepID=UPI0027E207A8|nr:hypothetical protein [Paenibacillus sp. LHD-117]MDQ6420401.1 hypothetical protein [Paenibacillus sp. LHD-117]
MRMGSLRVQDASGWTIFVFGVLAFILGLAGLIFPEFLLTLLGFTVVDSAARAEGDYTLVFMLASSMASLNMGAYYMLSALKNVKTFYYWTVPFRLLTCTVFTIASLSHLAPMRFIGVGAWEGVGAMATGIALYMESRRQRKGR